MLKEKSKLVYIYTSSVISLCIQSIPMKVFEQSKQIDATDFLLLAWDTLRYIAQSKRSLFYLDVRASHLIMTGMYLCGGVNLKIILSCGVCIVSQTF